MKPLELSKEEHLPVKSGAGVSFHLIQKENSPKSYTLRTGDINYHYISEGTALHSHDFAEIFIVLSGSISHYVNGEKQMLEAGSLVFIRPSDFHRFEVEGDKPCEIVNLAYRLELLLDFSRYLENDYFMMEFTAPVLPPVFHIPLPDSEKLGRLLLEISSEQLRYPERARIKIKALLSELFTRHFLMRDDDSAPARKEVPDWFESLCSEMRKPGNLTRGLDALYELAGKTPEHLCKCFRKYMKKTPTEFINELKVHYAAKLLSDSDEKIFSISSDLGFKSLSRFYKIFRQYYGVSPAKYRNMKLKTNIPL